MHKFIHKQTKKVQQQLLAQFQRIRYSKVKPSKFNNNLTKLTITYLFKQTTHLAFLGS